jgi:spore maturation protein CgeB
MTLRDVILLDHRSLHPVLRRELGRRGLKLEESRRWQDADQRTLACYTWFYEGMRSPLKTWRMSRHLRSQGVPLFAWNQDAPHYLNRPRWRLDWYDRARLLDLYATHTLADQRRLFADTQLYLPNAADTEAYNLGGVPATVLGGLRDAASYEHDVSFFGAMDGKRYKEMRARQEFFAALGERLATRGIRYLFREAGDMTAAQQAALIRNSRINLNFGASCDFGAPVASGLPERCYGIPACGGFLLCDKRTHARDDFTPGENWAEFDGIDDCVAKIEFWLAHFDAARDLAERCHLHVLERHTYARRAEMLHEALLSWHAGRRGLIR